MNVIGSFVKALEADDGIGEEMTAFLENEALRYVSSERWMP